MLECTTKVISAKPTTKGPRGHDSYVVVALLENGTRKTIDLTLTWVSREAEDLAIQIAGCEECQKQYIGGDWGPRHKASSKCEKGGHNHCDCVKCW